MGPDERGRVPLVLMYHSVGDRTADPYQVTVTPQRFAAQMALLDRLGVRGCSMADLLASPGGRRVGLTFDDGYRDFVTDALPVLDAHGFTATVFVLAGRIGGDNGWEESGPRKPLMTAAEVRAVAHAGMEIGSHGLLHRDLTTVPDDVLHAEVADSRGILADLVEAPVGGFCYPYGACGPRETEAVRDAGYGYGAAVGAPALPRQWAFPRTYAGEKDTAARLAAKYVRHLVRTA
jgi:peptidoglycan/xylan/chitin deacetylase (PgdA/CDA1 family)